jgi:threonine aldolase
MQSFKSDYLEGAHPKVLQKLTETNYGQTEGYGDDEYCAQAEKTIKKLCGAHDIGVHFLVGGTQTNLTLICAALRPHQGAISAASGHIYVHEAGAIESRGHRVIPLEGRDGKLCADQVRRLCDTHQQDRAREHTIQPKLVYISNATEIGSLYKKAELKALRKACDDCGLYLYMDGARLAYALTSEENDLNLEDITALCDAFYIGGTKAGLLFGEALVIRNKAIDTDFRYIMKQNGAMLAKGRLLGVQFQALLEDGLMFEIGKHANALAAKIKKACMAKNIPFLTQSPTNQQFPVFEDADAEKFDGIAEFWQKTDAAHTALRLCTGWATSEQSVDELTDMIAQVGLSLQ